MSDLSATFFPIDFSDPLDWWGGSSADIIDIEIPDALGELDDDCNMVALPSIIEDAFGEHSLPTPMLRDPRQISIALGNPIQVETLLDKCKNCVTHFGLEYY